MKLRAWPLANRQQRIHYYQDSRYTGAYFLECRNTKNGLLTFTRVIVAEQILNMMDVNARISFYLR